MKPAKHQPRGLWRGVRTRTVLAAPEPDAPPRPVTLPAAWEPEAAEALAGLVPGLGRIHLETAAEAWIDGAGRGAAGLNGASDLGLRLHALLLARRGAPDAALWRGEAAGVPGFVLNLPAFFEAETGFDVAAFTAAAEAAVVTLTALAPAAPRIAVRVADLDGLLAALGLDYDSDAARGVGAGVAALLRAAADAASVSLGGHAGLAEAVAAPRVPHLPGLAEAVASLCAAMAGRGMRHAATVAIAPPGTEDALLGIETGGIAPAFAPITAAGTLTRAARARLAALGVSPESALAATLAGRSPFPRTSAAAHAAMRDAVAAFIPALPALAAPADALPAGAARRELPPRPTGLARKVSIGGHRLFLRTAEYADGTPGEIGLTMPRENAATRGLLDALAQAVSIGLQHGVPLAEFVDAFLQTRFGPAGAVEGDPSVARASSVPDYLARGLAAQYLGRDDLPDAETEPEAPPQPQAAPMLPLDLPREAAGRPRLRLVS